MLNSFIKARKSIVLIPMILLIVFVSISVLGLCFFILESSRKISADTSSTQSFYFAESGIQEALYWYRQQGYFSLGETVINPGRYVLSADELGLLLVDERLVRLIIWGGFFYICDNLLLSNAADSHPIVVEKAVVSWQGAEPNTVLWRFQIGSYFWNGGWGATSPVTCPINAVINYGKYRAALTFRRQLGTPLVSSITITFFMSDGTDTGPLLVYNNSGATQGKMDFRFTAQGLQDAAGGSISNSIEAEYDTLTGAIIGYNKL